MSVRAAWHTPELSVDDDDPFAAPIEVVGVPIRLSGDVAQLAAELVDAVHAERQLTAHCSIRELPDTSCSACPLSGAYGALCRVARRQEELVTRLAALEFHGGQ